MVTTYWVILSTRVGWFLTFFYISTSVPMRIGVSLLKVRNVKKKKKFLTQWSLHHWSLHFGSFTKFLCPIDWFIIDPCILGHWPIFFNPVIASSLVPAFWVIRKKFLTQWSLRYWTMHCGSFTQKFLIQWPLHHRSLQFGPYSTLITT
jgi:hypothetical protein